MQISFLREPPPLRTVWEVLGGEEGETLPGDYGEIKSSSCMHMWGLG